MFGQIMYSFALAALAASQNLAMARHVPIGHSCEFHSAQSLLYLSSAGDGRVGGRLPHRPRIRSDREACSLLEWL